MTLAGMLADPRVVFVVPMLERRDDEIHEIDG